MDKLYALKKRIALVYNHLRHWTVHFPCIFDIELRLTFYISLSCLRFYARWTGVRVFPFPEVNREGFDGTSWRMRMQILLDSTSPPRRAARRGSGTGLYNVIQDYTTLYNTIRHFNVFLRGWVNSYIPCACEQSLNIKSSIIFTFFFVNHNNICQHWTCLHHSVMIFKRSI
jgi:hypothetical protein